MRRFILTAGALAAAVLILIQLVPYGRDHANPPVTGEPAWDSAATRALAVRACFDCHSNETVWPWYASVAPISWRLQSHVDDGREELNFSEWGSGEQEADDAAEEVREGRMPPWDYRLSHPEARLSDGELQALIAGLGRTFGSGEDGEDGEDD